jgi:hypothetical protein
MLTRLSSNLRGRRGSDTANNKQPNAEAQDKTND